MNGIRPQMLYGFEFIRIYLCDLPPRVIEYFNTRNIEKLEKYYTKSIHEITADVIKGYNLTVEEEERLLHEDTPSDRILLESYLPIDHPYLIALRDRWIFNHNNQFQILL